VVTSTTAASAGPSYPGQTSLPQHPGHDLLHDHPGQRQKASAVPTNSYGSDAPKEQGIDLPYSCRAGACSTVPGKISRQRGSIPIRGFLDDDQIAQGYALLCVSYPMSDCRIKPGVSEDSLKLLAPAFFAQSRLTGR